MTDPKESPENLLIHYEEEITIDSDSDPVEAILSSAGAWSDIDEEYFERLEAANQESVRDLWS
jgi:hypothetical protein